MHWVCACFVGAATHLVNGEAHASLGQARGKRNGFRAIPSSTVEHAISWKSLLPTPKQKQHKGTNLKKGAIQCKCQVVCDAAAHAAPASVHKSRATRMGECSG